MNARSIVIIVNLLVDIANGINVVVAILGATGSGKSALVSLIPRFYDVTSGRVTIDDVVRREQLVLLDPADADLGMVVSLC